MTTTETITRSDVIQAARYAGYMGVAVIHQGGSRSPYLAVAMTRKGTLSIYARNAHTHPTADAALADLHRMLVG